MNKLADEHESGIVIGRFRSGDPEISAELDHAHRHDYHIFLQVQKGKVAMEVDFERYVINAPAILYIHPSQVHRMDYTEDADVYILGTLSENLRSEYLKILDQGILPGQLVQLSGELIGIFDQTISLCETIFRRKDDSLFQSLLKDYCNAYIGLCTHYLKQNTGINTDSRFEAITRRFYLLLEQEYVSKKRPADYAQILNISTPYLTECVRNTTGYPVSYHIRQRLVLEAKRLLFHSDKSIKEIAHLLGFEDHAYFSRLFTGTTGMTASAFRLKNRD